MAKSNNTPQNVFLIILAILVMGTLGCSTGPYTGDLHNGEPHGYGVYHYEDGTVYEGQFRFGRRFGFGTITKPDGTKTNVAFHSGNQIYTKEQVKNMQSRMRWIDQSLAKNAAIRAASERADMLAIEKDRKRRNQIPDFNAFRDGPNLTGGINNTQVFTKPSQTNSAYPTPSKTFCNDYDFNRDKSLYDDILADARACGTRGQAECDAIRGNAYAYGRKAKKFLNQCNNSSRYRSLLMSGKTICLVTSKSQQQKDKCLNDFHHQYGVFK